MATKKQIERKHFNDKVRATYNSMPKGTWKLKELATMFECSVSTVWYAINGRS